MTDGAIGSLLTALKARDYRFTAVTPSTHARVLARPMAGNPTLRDIFGWNRAFTEGQIEPELLSLLQRAGSLDEQGGKLRSLVRVASLDDQLFLHSAFPTVASDAVFFGPDTYRFARFIRANSLVVQNRQWIVDMGCGSGAGGIVAGRELAPARLTLIDVNPEAIRLARENAAFAGVKAVVSLSERIPRGCSLVIANPPYMIDAAHRTYRDGGGMFGGEVAYEWTEQALQALVPGGTMLLYTGAAVIEGRPVIVDRIRSLCSDAGAAFHVEEIDPDVFGEELERSEYGEVERIAAFGIRIRKAGPSSH